MFVAQLDYISVPWADTAAHWPPRSDTESRYLSGEQIDRISDTLLDLPGLFEDLDIAILKDVRFPTRPPRADTEAESPLNWNPSASQARADLALAVTAAAIHIWNRLALGIHHRLADPLDAAEWLHGQLGRLALDPEAEAISRRIINRARRARNVIDHPRQTRYLGDCPDCGADLEAEQGDQHVLCGCGWTGEVDQLLHEAITAGMDGLYTDSELVGVFRIDGRHVTRNQINSWARAGRLAAHEHMRWSKHCQQIVTRRTYRLSDVEALVLDMERRHCLPSR